MSYGRRYFLDRAEILAALEVSHEDECDDDLQMEISQDDEVQRDEGVEDEQVEETFHVVPEDFEAVLPVNINKYILI
jgi:hypothetical protein